MEFDKTLPRDVLMKKIFRIVQEIPYRITPFEEFDNIKHACKETVTVNIERGDCRHKSTLLYNLLMQNNFEAEKAKVIFDWKDLPIPKEILDLLKNSGTIWVHDVIEVKLSDYSKSYVDPTWNPELKELGFPITEEWDGKGSTIQVTRGKLEYFNADEFDPKDHGINIDEEEAKQFAEALNEWLENSTRR